MRLCYLYSETNALAGRIYQERRGLFDLAISGPLPSTIDPTDLLGLSIGYRHILTKDQLALFPRGVVNLHTSYLPWNRGAHPNVWAIVDGTPAGVTLHWMDEGIDTGDIIAQRRVPVSLADTGETLYRKLETAGYDLFCQWWPRIVDGTAPRMPQVGEGTRHVVADLQWLNDQSWLFSDDGHYLFDRLRARTFTGHDGIILSNGKERVMARITLEPLPPEGDGLAILG